LLERFLLNLIYELGFYKNRVEKDMPSWLSYTLMQLKNIENSKKGVCILEEISGKSPEHISRVLKKYLNITPSTAVNKARIEHAASRLILTNDKIIEISLDCGFNSLGQFYNLFKKFYGVSPAQFRKRNYDSYFSDVQ